MLNELKAQADKTFTENGAVTYLSSGSDCLDLFSSIGGMRKADEAVIINKFERAYNENPDSATKLLFFARDIRGCLGERRIFRIILNRLAYNHPQTVNKNIGYIAELGRYDDLLCLIGTPCESKAVGLIKKRLQRDLKAMENEQEVSLLAKWMPSVNTSNHNTVQTAKTVAKKLNMSEKEYRKTLSKLRSYISIIENNLRTKDYTFDYAKQPSKAMFKYRQAFYRNDYDRYRQYLNDVNNGNAKMNASVLAPYEIITPYLGVNYSNSFMQNISDD